MEIAMTKISSRGQIVIPAEIREDFPEGEKLVIIKKDHQLLIEKVDDLGDKFKEDWEFAKSTEAILRKVKTGEKTLNEEEFMKEIEMWYLNARSKIFKIIYKKSKSIEA